MRKKLSEYILETFVIVLSILAAFALENWNESRKERQVEVKYLISLKLDLEEDLSKLVFMHGFRSNKITSANALLKNPSLSSPKDQLIFFNNLMTVFVWREFTPNKNTVEELVSSGSLSLIKNDSIRDQLQILNQQIEDLKTFREHSRREFEEYLYDRLGIYIDLNDYSNIDDLVAGLTIPVDTLSINLNAEKLKVESHSLLSDKMVRNGLYLASANNVLIVKYYDDIASNLEKLIETIDIEIRSD